MEKIKKGQEYSLLNNYPGVQQFSQVKQVVSGGAHACMYICYQNNKLFPDSKFHKQLFTFISLVLPKHSKFLAKVAEHHSKTWTLSGILDMNTLHRQWSINISTYKID